MGVTLVIVPQGPSRGIPRPQYGKDGWAFLYWPYLYLVFVATLPLWLATVVGLPVTSVGASITRPKMNQRTNHLKHHPPRPASPFMSHKIPPPPPNSDGLGSTRDLGFRVLEVPRKNGFLRQVEQGFS